ncbi:magnesium transporter [Alcaligenaceae bacterium B3P038]|nr:magnesium transporter [Alcaligenaceae bacterium B3P038]
MNHILKNVSFPAGTAGATATPRYASVAAELTAADALTTLRAVAPNTATIYVIYVIDPGARLIGTVSLRELVMAPPAAQVATLMRPAPVVVNANAPAQHAVDLISRHDLLAIPVVNADQRMLGIVTVDDAMDLDRVHDGKRLAQFGGTALLGNADLSLRNSSFASMFKQRVFWLAILTVFGILTSTFVAHQEEILTEVLILAAFIAPIVDMGGNTGSQSATLVIRAMALGELKLRWRDVWFVIKREIPLALALGVCIAVLEAILAYFSKDVNSDVLLVVGLSMLCCTMLGGIIGGLLPFAARRLGTDPATLSSPMITSIMDLVGVFIYFGFAYAFLGDLLI